MPHQTDSQSAAFKATPECSAFPTTILFWMRSSFCVRLDTIKCFYCVPAVGTRGFVGEEHGNGLRILHQLGCIPGSIAHISSMTSNQFPRQQGVCSIKPLASLQHCHVALVKHLDLGSCFLVTRRPRTAPPRYDDGHLY